jgi:hypothetical protein
MIPKNTNYDQGEFICVVKAPHEFSEMLNSWKHRYYIEVLSINFSYDPQFLHDVVRAVIYRKEG